MRSLLNRTSFVASALALLASELVQAQKPYYSGEVKTRDAFRYGKFRTRMQGSGQRGTVAAFFTYWAGDDQMDWSFDQQQAINLQVVPSMSESGSKLETSLAFGSDYDTYAVPGYNPGTDWHDYELTWTPDFIAWSIDGSEVRRETSSAYNVRAMNREQLLHLHVWTPTFASWGAGLDPSQMPFYTRFAYVEAYDYDEASGNF